MADLTVRVIAGTPVPVDDLCPSCWKPALVEIPMHTLSGDGVGLIGVWRGCVDCGHREKTT